MKSKLKLGLTFFITLFFFSGAFAQPDSKKDKIDALRVAFISNKVNFSTQESEFFWPLYKEMNDKLTNNRKTFRKQFNNNTNYNFTTDKEAETYLVAELNLKQKEIEIYKEYYDKFKKIVPIKKIAAFRRAEEDFKKEIIKRIKEN